MVEGSLRKSFKSESVGTPSKCVTCPIHANLPAHLEQLLICRKRLQSKVWDSIRGTAAAHEPHWRCLQGFQVSLCVSPHHACDPPVNLRLRLVYVYLSYEQVQIVVCEKLKGQKSDEDQ